MPLSWICFKTLVGISVSIRVNVQTKDSFAKKDYQLFKKQRSRSTILSSFRWAGKWGGVKAIIGKEVGWCKLSRTATMFENRKIRCMDAAIRWKTGEPVVNLKRKWKKNKVARHFVREIVIRRKDYRKVPWENDSEGTAEKQCLSKHCRKARVDASERKRFGQP
jgi:hypothetical protein